MSVLAYFDPGSGSLIASAAAAGFAGVAVVAKSSWHKAKGKLRGGRKEQEQPEAPVDGE
jgi:hypothetical protein